MEYVFTMGITHEITKLVYMRILRVSRTYINIDKVHFFRFVIKGTEFYALI